MITIFILILLLGIVVAGVVLARGQVWKKIPAVLSWLGCVIALGSFFFLPWIIFGAPGTILKNTTWLAKQTIVLETLKQLPGLDRLFESTTSWSAQEVWSALNHPLKEQIFQISERGDFVNGWRLLSLLGQANWLEAFFLIFSLVVTLLSIATSLIGMFGLKIPKPFAVSMAVAAGIVFIELLISIPRLDQLGVSHEIFLRLLLALAEARVSSGAGWYVTGLLMIVFSNVIISVLPDPVEYEYNPDDDGYEF